MVQIDQEKKDYTKSTRERLDDEIEKAFQSVTITKFQTEQLHSNWRDHLFRLSAGKLRFLESALKTIFILNYKTKQLFYYQ